MQTDGLSRWLGGIDMYLRIWRGAFQDSDEACRSTFQCSSMIAQHAGLSPRGLQECQTLTVMSKPESSSSDNQRVPIHKAEGCIASADGPAEGLELYRSFQTVSGKCTAGMPAMPVS